MQRARDTVARHGSAAAAGRELPGIGRQGARGGLTLAQLLRSCCCRPRPRSATHCWSKLQVARLRLLLATLLQPRLAEDSPAAAVGVAVDVLAFVASQFACTRPTFTHAGRCAVIGEGGVSITRDAAICSGGWDAGWAVCGERAMWEGTHSIDLTVESGTYLALGVVTHPTPPQTQRVFNPQNGDAWAPCCVSYDAFRSTGRGTEFGGHFDWAGCVVTMRLDLTARTLEFSFDGEPLVPDENCVALEPPLFWAVHTGSTTSCPPTVRPTHINVISWGFS